METDNELLCIYLLYSPCKEISSYRGGRMVSALETGSSGLGTSRGAGIELCSWARQLTLTVPLSTQVYKWIPANLMRRGTL